MARLFCGLLFFLFVDLVASWSNGAPGCDYRNFKIGSDSLDLKNVEDIHCDGCIMAWTNGAVKSDAFYWRSGADVDPSKDPSTYTPDTIMPLYLYTRDLDKVWAGIHLHARTTQTPSSSVGGWEVRGSEDFREVQGCLGHALTHSHANPKLSRSVFYFKTPPKGTGTIKFETLLKQGYQGTGNFYWPAIDLTLKEGGISSTTLVAEPGRSCSEACNDVSLACAPTTFQLLISTQACMITVRTCDGSGPSLAVDPTNSTSTSSRSICSAPSQTCDQAPPSCGAQNSSQSLVCSCRKKEVSLSGVAVLRVSPWLLAYLAVLAGFVNL